IYVHFKNKEALFQSLVERSFARLLEALEELDQSYRNTDLVSRLKAGLRVYVDFGLRHPNDYRFAFMLRPPDEKRPYKPGPAFQALRTFINRCIQEKRFRAIDGELASQ